MTFVPRKPLTRPLDHITLTKRILDVVTVGAVLYLLVRAYIPWLLAVTDWGR